MIARKWMIISLVIFGILLTGISIKPVLAFTGGSPPDQGSSGWLSKTRKPPPPSATPKTQTPTPIVTKTSIFRTAISTQTTTENTQTTAENTQTNIPTPMDTIAPTSVDHVQLTLAAAQDAIARATIEALENGDSGGMPGCNPTGIVIPIGLTMVGLWKTRKRHTEL